MNAAQSEDEASCLNNMRACRLAVVYARGLSVVTARLAGTGDSPLPATSILEQPTVLWRRDYFTGGASAGFPRLSRNR